MNKNQSAFTLIELTTVITIAAIFYTIWMSFYKNKIKIDNIEKLSKQFVVIEKALVDYYRDNKRLPCPATQNLAVSDSNFAQEQVTTSSCTDSLPTNTCNSSNVSLSNNTYIGALPAETLGLGKNMILDPWGSKITYAVDKIFTCANSTAVAEIFYTGTSSLAVNETSENAELSKAAYVVVSHGENQYGAYNNLGVQKSHPTISNNNEVENSNNDNTLIYDDVHLKSSNLPASYDDYTSFMSPELLIVASNSKNNDNITYDSDYSGNVLAEYNARLYGSECACVATNSTSDFVPSDLAPLLWLDASDSSTVTLSGSLVSQWSDKSGNNNHATQTNSSYMPTYSSNILNNLNMVYFSRYKQ